jgi:hypothetical protein
MHNKLTMLAKHDFLKMECLPFKIIFTVLLLSDAPHLSSLASSHRLLFVVFNFYAT